MECEMTEPTAFNLDFGIDEKKFDVEITATKLRSAPPKNEIPMYIQMGFISKYIKKDGNPIRKIQCLTCDTVLKPVGSKGVQAHR